MLATDKSGVPKEAQEDGLSAGVSYGRQTLPQRETGIFPKARGISQKKTEDIDLETDSYGSRSNIYLNTTACKNRNSGVRRAFSPVCCTIAAPSPLLNIKGTRKPQEAAAGGRCPNARPETTLNREESESPKSKEHDASHHDDLPHDAASKRGESRHCVYSFMDIHCISLVIWW